jgi:hypothetical protein
MYEYTTRSRRGMMGLGTEPEEQVGSIQSAILENGCSLPRFGRDSRWGSETEAGTRCLAERRGWDFVLQSWPWVAQRMTVPQQGVAQQVASVVPGVAGNGQTPAWLPWAAAGVGLVGIIMIGSYVTAKMEEERERRGEF